MSIRLKLFILFFTFALLPLLSVSIFSLFNYEKSLERDRLLQLQDIVTFEKEEIESYFNGLKASLEMAEGFYNIKKNLPILSQSTNDKNNPEFITAKSILDQQLQQVKLSLKLSSVLLLDTQGTVVYSSQTEDYNNDFLGGSGHLKTAFTEGKKGIYFSDIFLDAGKKESIFISGPAHDLDDNFAGIIVFKLNMGQIYSLIHGPTGFSKTGEVLIGKRVGNQAVFLSPLKYDSTAALKRKVTIGDKFAMPLQEAVSGKSGSGQMVDYRGKKVVAAWTYISGFNWGIVTKIDTEEAFAEAIELRNMEIVTLIIVFLLAALMSFSIAKSIAKPIKKLSKGAEELGSGNLNFRLGNSQNDEIGQLSRTFDKMAQDLQSLSAARDAERKRLYDVLETLPVYVILLDNDYRVPFANKFFRERFGDADGKRCYEYLFKRSQVCENCESYKVMATNSTHHWEWLGPDNRNYDIYDFPFSDSDGEKMILEMGIDITEQKKAEEKLRQASLYSRRLIESSLDPLVTISAEGKITDVNQATIRATGRTREELIGTEFSNYFTEPKKAQEGYQKVFSQGFVTDYPLTMHNKDGRLIEVLYNASVFKDVQGKVMGVFAAARDITVLKQAENELKKHRDNLEILVKERTGQLEEISARLQTVVDNLSEGLIVSDLKGNLLHWNPTAIFLHGFTDPEEYKRNLKDFSAKFELSTSKGEVLGFDQWPLSRILRGEVLHELEINIRRLDKDWQRVFSYGGLLAKDKEGKPFLAIITLNDITERRIAEETLRKERESLQAIFDVVDTGMLLVDEQGMVKKINKTVSLWMGEKDFSSLTDKLPGNILGCIYALSREQGCGNTPACSSCLIRQTFEQVLKTGISIHGVEIQTVLFLNGVNTSLWLEINVDPVTLENKRHVILSINNVTLRKQAEEILKRDKETFEKLVDEKSRELMNVQLKLDHVKRLSDIGTLAATVAHELRNPLAAIKMAVYNAQRKAQNPILDKHFSNIGIKLHESENIIDNLLFYSKIKAPHTASINLFNIISTCINDAKSRFPEYQISIIRNDDVIKNLLVEADAVQMKEVFTNLLINSFDATGPGGHIEIKAETAGGIVKIAVKDNGMGIEKADLENIFQPFFSTKAKGTGLGLTVAQQVVKLHDGSIYIESQQGKGTTVTVALPIKHNRNA
ncbi:MAG: PAS domain S-box protein [Candidatus Omnitrophica bacterium]|nr:PAS domain S-box protein [Candidatus Omnitrophota bacterium]